MESKNYNFFEKIIHSITDFGFYERIIKESSGRAVLYLFLLSLLLSVFGAANLVFKFSTGVNVLTKSFVRNVPDFEFKNGELNVSGQMPIILGQESNEVLIIDTTGQTNEHVLDNYSAGIFISKTYILNKKNSVNSEKMNFSELANVNFNKQQVIGLLPLLKYINILIVLFVFLGTIVGKLISSLFVSLIGLIVNAATKSNLVYDEVYRAGVYAMTLPSIIKALAGFLPMPIPFFFFIYYGIVIFYLIKAFEFIRAIKNKPQINVYAPYEPS